MTLSTEELAGARESESETNEGQSAAAEAAITRTLRHYVSVYWTMRSLKLAHRKRRASVSSSGR